MTLRGKAPLANKLEYRYNFCYTTRWLRHHPTTGFQKKVLEAGHQEGCFENCRRKGGPLTPGRRLSTIKEKKEREILGKGKNCGRKEKYVYPTHREGEAGG